jgi:hypothetical protein
MKITQGTPNGTFWGKTLQLQTCGQNTSYRPNIGQNENIGIGIGGRYVGANISVSAKVSAVRIYLYRYRLDPYRSNSSWKYAGMSCHMEGPFWAQFQPSNIIYDLIKTNIGCCLFWSATFWHLNVRSY